MVQSQFQGLCWARGNSSYLQPQREISTFLYHLESLSTGAFVGSGSILRVWSVWIFFPCCYCLVAKLCLILCNPMGCSLPGSFVQGDSPGKNTGVGCHALLQEIFPTQGSNPDVLQCIYIIKEWKVGSQKILRLGMRMSVSISLLCKKDSSLGGGRGMRFWF